MAIWIELLAAKGLIWMEKVKPIQTQKVENVHFQLNTIISDISWVIVNQVGV